MIRFSGKSVPFLTVICALFFATSGGASAMEQQFPDNNCAITIPEAWILMTNYPPQPGVLAVYSDATGNRRVILQMCGGLLTGPLNDRFITGFEKGYQESGGGAPLSGKYIEVDGVRSYERLGSFTANGKRISTMIRLIPGEDQYYDLQAMRFDGDASADPELQQVIGSFRFIRPFVPSEEHNSMAFLIGKLTFYVMVMVAVVMAVVAIVVYAVRSNRTPRPPVLPRN